MAGRVVLDSPIPVSLFPMLAILLIGGGLVSTASFFVYEVRNTKFSRQLTYEIFLGTLSSVLLGFGVLFLLLWTGVYV
ncbi:hypothetical protein WJX72_000148 [[Myrmecia] bisecta]|uniref:Dolichyl-diphosphooligosaccharide-protein glycosyltransferase subunit OST5 n=1 Tax=[Myrmecia] bisecta TaxID=41462 RepID=A0AAW1P8G0_9CHLO